MSITHSRVTEAVRAAVGMLSCRFGTSEAEADRRGHVRALVQSSRALATVLEHFARKAAPHKRGEHSTPDMRADADAMAQALADWSFAGPSFPQERERPQQEA